MGKYLNQAFYSTGVAVREYMCWQNILNRVKSQVAYKAVTVCEGWKNYDLFYNDIRSLPNWFSKDRDGRHYCIDKDVICYLKGIDKHYSIETCLMLPNTVNASLAIRDVDRKYSYLPLGVVHHKGGGFDVNGRYKRYRKHSTPEDAQRFYYARRQEDFINCLKDYDGSLDKNTMDMLMSINIKKYHKDNGLNVVV